jgi:hypothetical protein
MRRETMFARVRGNFAFTLNGTAESVPPNTSTQSLPASPSPAIKLDCQARCEETDSEQQSNPLPIHRLPLVPHA